MKKSSITCPNCGWEYLPSEIFYPDKFFGHQRNIIKGESGDILGYQGEEQNLTESFVCDNCLKMFDVEATVSFKVCAKEDIFQNTDIANLLEKVNKD